VQSDLKERRRGRN